MKATRIRTLVAGCVVGAMGLAMTGCGSTGVSFREVFTGQSKRQQLAASVGEVRDSMVELKGRFTASLDASVMMMEVSDEEPMDARYASLKREIRRTQSAINATRRRVDSMGVVAGAMFEDWQTELDQYNRAELRSFSEQQLSATKAEFAGLQSALGRTDESIDPVVGAMNDQVLFLNKNLSDRAIHTLSRNMVDIEREVAGLMERLDTSIGVASEFAETLGRSPAEADAGSFGDEVEPATVK